MNVGGMVQTKEGNHNLIVDTCYLRALVVTVT